MLNGYYKLLAVIHKIEQPKALLVGPDGVHRILEMGDHVGYVSSKRKAQDGSFSFSITRCVGKHHGEVVDIQHDKLVIREEFMDGDQISFRQVRFSFGNIGTVSTF
jgi:Tfp pilus assembly protein PilP